MKLVSYIYSGFYYLYQDSKLSSKADFSAWASCTLAAIFYAFAILMVAGKFYDDRFGDGSFPFGAAAIGSALAIGLLSDWRIQHTWFGAAKIELPSPQRSKAKLSSLVVLLGSWAAFISMGLALYT
jgi:hypothetical protein